MVVTGSEHGPRGLFPSLSLGECFVRVLCGFIFAYWTAVCSTPGFGSHDSEKLKIERAFLSVPGTAGVGAENLLDQVNMSLAVEHPDREGYQSFVVYVNLMEIILYSAFESVKTARSMFQVRNQVSLRKPRAY